MPKGCKKIVRRERKIFNKNVKNIARTSRNAGMQDRKNAKTAGRIFRADVKIVGRSVKNGEKPGRIGGKTVGKTFSRGVVNAGSGDAESLVKTGVKREVEADREWDNSAVVRVEAGREWDSNAVVNVEAGKAGGEAVKVKEAEDNAKTILIMQSYFILFKLKASG